jgi:hypothetical protein
MLKQITKWWFVAILLVTYVFSGPVEVDAQRTKPIVAGDKVIVVAAKLPVYLQAQAKVSLLRN